MKEVGISQGSAVTFFSGVVDNLVAVRVKCHRDSTFQKVIKITLLLTQLFKI